MTLTITGADNSGSVQIKPTRVTLTKRHSIKIIPLGPTAEPLCLDLGIAEYDIEIQGFIYGDQGNVNVATLLHSIKNPVSITTEGNYPEIPSGANWRIIEKTCDRRGGWIHLWEVKIRIQRTSATDIMRTGGV